MPVFDKAMEELIRPLVQGYTPLLFFFQPFYPSDISRGQSSVYCIVYIVPGILYGL